MKTMQIPAYAKINLTLDVLGKRNDGYHDLCMVMQSVALSDEITISETGEPGITLTSNLSFLPNTDKNIAMIAARAFAETTGVSLDGLAIDLKKNIPVCAGTAGGSSDGAAVLRGLNEWFGTELSLRELAKIGEKVGSDVPYCVLGCTALAEGRGEILTELSPMPKCYLVLCKPGFPISTPELFGKIDDCKLKLHPDTEGMIEALKTGKLGEISRRLYNVFEDVLPAPRKAVIDEIKQVMLNSGALGTCMSGTGPTVFGIFDDRDVAAVAYETLRQEYEETFLTENI